MFPKKKMPGNHTHKGHDIKKNGSNTRTDPFYSQIPAYHSKKPAAKNYI